MDALENGADGESMRLARGWLLMSVFSLVFAGLFALMVALARTPGVERLLPPGLDYIYVALVGHVVLAVVIWFLAFEGFLWVYTSTALLGRAVWSAALGWAALLCSWAGMALVIVSVVLALGPPMLANYVPVLMTPVFYAGLLLFAAGVCMNLVNTGAAITKAVRSGVSLPPAAFGMCVAGGAVFAAFACFALSGYFQHSAGAGPVDFERLFWGGGHMLQFANTIAMAAAWLCLSAMVFEKGLLSGPWARFLFLPYIFFILPAPFIYFMRDAAEQREGFTRLMQWGLGPSTLVFIFAGLRAIFTQKKRRWGDPGFSSLVLSIALFILGGAMALNISGANTVIPAHYHCVIGAVTVAFMGLFYRIAPRLGRGLYSARLAGAQPWVYSLGIMLFATGLFLAGAYGAARKTYGAGQHLDSVGKIIGMSVMGAGGLVAIAGGVLFVWNALLTLLAAPREDRAKGLEGVLR